MTEIKKLSPEEIQANKKTIKKIIKWFFYSLGIIIGSFILLAIILAIFDVKTPQVIEKARQDSIKTATEQRQIYEQQIEINKQNNKNASERAKLSADLIRWEKNSSGIMATVNFKLTNNSETTFQDIRVRFRFRGESGTVVSRHTQLFPVVLSPGDSRKFKDETFFIENTATNLEIDVIDAVPI